MAVRKTTKKSCTKCGKSKAISADNAKSEFYKDKSQRDGYAVWCKDCEANYNRAYFAALKAAGATRKSDITDPKARAKFDAKMKAERVVRGSKVATTKAATKATPKATAKSAKKAPPKARKFQAI